MAEDKTYYAHQPTAAQTQINWAEISSNVSGMLNEEVRIRQEKRAAIDEASRQYQQTLNEVDQGQSATANQWWLQAASDMQHQMLMQDRLLKSGALKPKDYTIMRQNLTDGTDGLIGVFNQYNAEFKERMDRMDCKDPTGVGCSQDLEQWAMVELENFGNFQKTAVVVNPETGMLSVGNIDEKGQLLDGANNVRSIMSLQSLIARRYDKYDLDVAAQTYADSVGNWDVIERKYGSATAKGLITKISDPFFKGFDKKELMDLGMSEQDAIDTIASNNVYKAGEDQLVSDIMSNWSQTSSILTNTVRFVPGTTDKYTFTFDEARGDNEILLRKDDQGQIFAEYTDEQREVVDKAIRDNVRNRLDRKITGTTVVGDYTRPSAGEEKAAAGEAAQQDIVGLWSEVWYGTEDEKRAALQGILGMKSVTDEIGINDIKFENGKITFVNNNPELTRTVEVGDNPSKSDWIRAGVELHGLSDKGKIEKAAGAFPKDRGYVAQVGPLEGIGARPGTPPVVDSVEEVARLTSTAVKDNFFKGMDDADVQADIEAIVAPLGFIVNNPTNFPGNDQLTITNPDTEASITVYTNENKAESKKQAAALRAFINGQLTKANSDAYLRGSNRGAAQGGVDAFGNPIDDVVEEETTEVTIPRTFPVTGIK